MTLRFREKFAQKFTRKVLNALRLWAINSKINRITGKSQRKRVAKKKKKRYFYVTTKLAVRNEIKRRVLSSGS